MRLTVVFDVQCMHIWYKLFPRVLVDEYLCRINCPVFTVECSRYDAGVFRELHGSFEKPDNSPERHT